MNKFNIAIKGFDNRENRLIERMIHVLSMQTGKNLSYHLINENTTDIPDCFIVNQDAKNDYLLKIKDLRKQGVSISFISIGDQPKDEYKYIQRPITVAKLRKALHDVIVKHFNYIPGLIISEEETYNELLSKPSKNNTSLQVIKRRAMVVDDNKTILKTMKAALNLQDFQVDLISNPNLALEHLSYYKYDVIFLDVMMPFISGYDLAKEIRKVNRDIPLIILTSKSSPLDKLKSSLAGVNYFLSKPVSNEVLLQVLKKFSLSKVTLNEK